MLEWLAVVSDATTGMGSSGSGTMQGFGNTAFSSNSKYASVRTYIHGER